MVIRNGCLSVLGRWLIALLVSSALGTTKPASASAAPAILCPCGVTTATPAVISLQTSVLAALSASYFAIRTAIGLMGGGVASNVTGVAAAAHDAAKATAETRTIQDYVNATRTLQAENTVNTQSLNCRLHTVQDTMPQIEKFTRDVSKGLESGLVELFFNQDYAGDRLRLMNQQLNCRLGQMTVSDFGQVAWDKMNAGATSPCFTDPDFTHASSAPTTILDSPTKILLQPTQAQWQILLNPDAGVGNAQNTWNALNRQQKQYTSGYLYIQNMAIASMQVMPVYGRAAETPINMVVAVQNLAAFSKLNAMAYMLQRELARRTAPDAGALGLTRVAANAPKIGNQLIEAGVAPADFRVSGTSYISPALYAYARGIGYCAQPKIINGAQWADNGTDAEKTGNVLQCDKIRQTYMRTEAAYENLFTSTVRGITGVRKEFTSPAPTPVKAEADTLRKNVHFPTGKTESSRHETTAFVVRE